MSVQPAHTVYCIRYTKYLCESEDVGVLYRDKYVGARIFVDGERGREGIIIL